MLSNYREESALVGKGAYREPADAFQSKSEVDANLHQADENPAEERHLWPGHARRKDYP
jgi:hypothetical protein